MAILRVFMVFLSLLGGCQKHSSKAEGSSQNTNNRFLQISFGSEVRSLHPRIGSDYPSAHVVKMLFDGLMIMGPDGTVQQGIAERFDISKDQKTYTFYLRPCKWSNGDEVTAFDFEYSWKKTVDPSGGTTAVQNFYPIKNVQEVVQKKTSVDSIGVKALNEKTLQVELAHPTPYFLEVLATPAYSPVNKNVDLSKENWANCEGKDFVCNGPFILKKHRLENEMQLEKNPKYWNVKSVRLPGINIYIVKDPTTHLAMFEKREVEWLGRPLARFPLEAVDSLKTSKQLKFFNNLAVYWFFINTESYPFHNKKMRKAFAYAIDRKALTENILRQGEVPALGVLPYSLASQKKPFFKDNDKKVANLLFKEALSELGIKKKELPEIVLNSISGSLHQRLAQALQQQWKEAFNLNVVIESQEWKSHFGKLQRANFQMGGMIWQSWLRDPIYIMQTFKNKSDGVNMSRWENQKYRDLLEASEEELDPQVRKSLFNQAETILMDEMPVIPIYFTTSSYSKDEKLKGVYLCELCDIDFRWAYFED